MAFANLREDIEEEFNQYLLTDPSVLREASLNLRTSSAESMREWRRLNPAAALAARKRWDATKKARRAEVRLTAPRKSKGPAPRVFDELEFLRLLREGRTGKQIAQTLNTSAATVSRLRKKLGLGLELGANQYVLQKS